MNENRLRDKFSCKNFTRVYSIKPSQSLDFWIIRYLTVFFKTLLWDKSLKIDYASLNPDLKSKLHRSISKNSIWSSALILSINLFKFSTLNSVNVK